MYFYKIFNFRKLKPKDDRLNKAESIYEESSESLKSSKVMDIFHSKKL